MGVFSFANVVQFWCGVIFSGFFEIFNVSDVSYGRLVLACMGIRERLRLTQPLWSVKCTLTEEEKD